MDFTLFAKRLKEARKKAGLSQAELAQRCDIAISTLSTYEKATGEKGAAPKLDIAVKLADALGVSLDWLCERSSGETASSSSRAFTKKLVELVREDYLQICQGILTYQLNRGTAIDEDMYNSFFNNLDELNKSIVRLEKAGLPPDMLEKVKEQLQESLLDEGEKLFDTDVLP